MIETLELAGLLLAVLFVVNVCFTVNGITDSITERKERKAAAES